MLSQQRKPTTLLSIIETFRGDNENLVFQLVRQVIVGMVNVLNHFTIDRPFPGFSFSQTTSVGFPSADAPSHRRTAKAQGSLSIFKFIIYNFEPSGDRLDWFGLADSTSQRICRKFIFLFPVSLQVDGFQILKENPFLICGKK